MNYTERAPYQVYRHISAETEEPDLMEDGDDVCDLEDEDLGDIREIMVDMRKPYWD